LVRIFLGGLIDDRVDQLGDGLRFDVLVDAIGRQYEYVALFDRECFVVEMQLRIDAHGLTQIAFVLGNPDSMILGQLLQCVVDQAIDAGVADMEEVGRRGFDDQRTQGADIAPVFVVAVLTLLGLGVQPGVGRH
jgi:hypothetical protein